MDKKTFKKIIKALTITSKCTDSRIVKPILLKVIDKHFHHSPKAFGTWYGRNHHCYFSTKAEAIAINEGFIQKIQAVDRKYTPYYFTCLDDLGKSDPAVARRAKKLRVFVKKIRSCEAPNRRELQRLRNSDMQDDDWVVLKDFNFHQITWLDVLTIRFSIKYLTEKPKVLSKIVQRYVKTHCDEIIATYNRFKK